MLFSRLKNETKKYELILEYKKGDKIKEMNNNDIFGNLYNYMRYIFDLLWSRPYLTAMVLSKSKLQNIKDNLANFFVNNFYENIISNNNKDEQLLYIITILLREEIQKLNKTDSLNSKINSFLSDSPCGYILYHFCFKKEVQSFFRIILLNIIEKIEISPEIILNPEQMDNLFIEISKKEIDNKKTEGNKKNKLS